jgi:RNA polymerase sigma factor (sigma-70 family)
MKMHGAHGTSLQTRSSLLRRLKTGNDQQGWQDFYRIYGGLIRYFAEKAGLTADEVEEVVQETAIGVARRLPEFVYDPKVCRFKTWLLNLVRWRIQDQIRRRPRASHESDKAHPTAGIRRHDRDASTYDTATVERVADPTVPEFGAEWDAAWEKNLFDQALAAVRERADERQFQVFDLYVMKDWPPQQVAQTLRISVARVYLAKHRISALLKKEIRQLEREAERALR